MRREKASSSGEATSQARATRPCRRPRDALYGTRRLQAVSGIQSLCGEFASFAPRPDGSPALPRTDGPASSPTTPPFLIRLVLALRTDADARHPRRWPGLPPHRLRRRPQLPPPRHRRTPAFTLVLASRTERRPRRWPAGLPPPPPKMHDPRRLRRRRRGRAGHKDAAAVFFILVVIPCSWSRRGKRRDAQI